MRSWRDSIGVAVRLLGSAVVASIVVVAMVNVGIGFLTDRDEPEGRVLQPVSVLSPAQLAALLGEDERPVLPEPPAPVEMPDFGRSERTVTGFVQLSFRVLPDGSVSDVQVLDAIPAGYYEGEARAVIEARSYSPSYVDGAAVVSERTEIIDFEVPAAPP